MAVEANLILCGWMRELTVGKPFDFAYNFHLPCIFLTLDGLFCLLTSSRRRTLFASHSFLGNQMFVL